MKSKIFKYCALSLILVLTVAFAGTVIAQEVESNDTRGLADRIRNLTIRGTISHRGDVDWFVLNGQEGYNPTFTIYHSSGADFDFYVYSNKSQVGHGMGTQSGDTVTCNVPGTCYVKVYSHRGAGSYSIRIRP